jgi:regulatory protein
MSAGIITALNGQRRHPERANLHIDGEFSCGIAWELVFTERLRVGDRVDAPTLERLRGEDERWRARHAMLSLLAVRPRTRRELSDRLRRKGFAGDAVEHALGEAGRLGLLDDTAFAEMWVRDRLRLRPRGSRALQAELVRKGVSPDAAADAVRRVMRSEAAQDGALCAAAATKWARSAGRRDSAGTPEERRRAERRLSAFLGRRGFPPADIRAAVQAVLRGEQPGRPGQ